MKNIYSQVWKSLPTYQAGRHQKVKTNTTVIFTKVGNISNFADSGHVAIVT